MRLHGGLHSGYTQYLDIAISIALAGFLATVAFARYLLSRGTVHPESPGRTLQ